MDRRFPAVMIVVQVACTSQGRKDPAQVPVPSAPVVGAAATPAGAVPSHQVRETFIDRMMRIYYDVDGELPLDAFYSKLERAPDENPALFVGCKPGDWAELTRRGLPDELITRLQGLAPEACLPPPGGGLHRTGG